MDDQYFQSFGYKLEGFQSPKRLLKERITGTIQASLGDSAPSPVPPEIGIGEMD